MKAKIHGMYEIDDDIRRMNFDVLEKWLSQTYWSPRIGKEEIYKGAVNSTMVVGCYLGQEQVGYMRLISDKTRIGYIMDVYVELDHRNKGIARQMILFALNNPELKDVYQWLLATRDAHTVYSGIGFSPLPNPERWMMIKKEKVR
jgi:GNAT superfamily N-acetyltransferase